MAELKNITEIGNGLDKSSRLTISPGENKVVRIVSKVREISSHFIKINDEISRVFCPSEGCPLCRNGEPVSRRWAVNVINKTEGDPNFGKVQVLEGGSQIFIKGIKKYANHPKFGKNVATYDFEIHREGAGKYNTSYDVIPSPEKSPLTKEEKKYVKENLFDLIKLYPEGKIEDIENIIQELNSETDLNENASSDSKLKNDTEIKEEEKDEDEEEDDELDFLNDLE